MNRLWVRLSLTFGSIVLAVSVMPFIVLLIFRLFGISDFVPPGAEELTADELERLSAFVDRAINIELRRIIIGSGIIGVIAGIVASRAITRPLSKLEEGAKALAGRDFDYRVDIDRGGDEIQAVASSFNFMADELERAEKQRKNLLADVAHELRTPLTVIQGNLRGILDDVFPLEKDEIARLFDQTQHLTHLVNDLHELAQAEAQALKLNFSEVGLPELLQNIAAGFRPLAEQKGVELRVELLGKLPDLWADRNRLQQSLNNLISNAIRYTPEGGSVTLQGESDGEFVHLRVIDTGVGIAAEHLPNVFNRFYRTDASRQRHTDQSGTGLGLAIVKAIIENHGGHVAVASEGQGHGTTFTLVLPFDQPS